jgi:polyhydroxybutyrate depolymerase
VQRTAVLVVVAALALSLSTAPAAEAAAGSGCGTPRRAGTRAHTVNVDGWVRRYHVTVPPRYTSRQRVPLVVDLHGAGSNAGEEMLLSRMRQHAASRGWIVATPDAGRPFWLPPGLSPDDKAFLRAVVQDVGRRLCIDAGRRFAVGMSNGAGMAAAMTCIERRTFSGVGGVAGVNLFQPCPGQRPVPIIAVHGTADPVVPYEGGVTSGPAQVGVVSVAQRMAQWAERNRCTGGPVENVVVPTVNRIRYQGCEARVQLLEVEGGGHTWPGGPVLPPHLGHTSDAIDATERILDFLARI